MSLLNKDLANGKKLFDIGEYTCVLCKGDILLTSKEKGVKPLVEWLESGEKYVGFSAVDKIVGRAAAHLYILMNVTAVHGSVMSREAVKLLSEHNIEVSFDRLTDSIINRKGNDICPMEKAVSGIDDPITAFNKIKETIIKLQKNQ